MQNNKLVTILIVIGAIALFAGFMSSMSYQRHLESLNPVHDIKSVDEFNNELTTTKEPLFVFFYSKKTSDSVKQLPLVERAAKDYQGRVKFVKVSGDTLPEIPLSLGIDQVPAMIVVKFADKTIVGHIGFLDLPDLQKLIDAGINAKPAPKPAQPSPQPAQPNPQPAHP